MPYSRGPGDRDVFHAITNLIKNNAHVHLSRQFENVQNTEQLEKDIGKLARQVWVNRATVCHYGVNDTAKLNKIETDLKHS
jgi:hypothetical protein